MYEVTTNLDNGTIIIYDNFDVSQQGTEDSTPYFNNIGDEYVINIANLQKVSDLTKFTYDTLGLNSDRFLLQYYRISRNGTSWTDWFDLNINIDNFPKIDPLDPLYVEIKWVRSGESEDDSIRLLEYKIYGELLRNDFIMNESTTMIIGPSETKIMRSPFIFKVFGITDIEIIPEVDLDSVDIKYRYSQDSTKTWAEWEPLTKENITTVRINPIRFFQIEYSVTNTSRSPISIRDINLIGDFQNVTKDYQKSNLFGIRTCCQSNQWGYYDSDGNYHPNTTMDSTGSGSGDGTGGSGVCDSNVFDPMTDDEKANLYNPYAQNTAVNLLEKLSADSEQIFGHKVFYFATDADKKGQDHTLNEFQLFNIACKGDLKVSIEGNNFPDSQIKMNIFDLDLFDTMEAHVTKQQFKQIFGVQRRPAKEDFLYFCQVNRMYQIEHAQQFRGFNNSAVYYKLILKKFTQKANVQTDNPEIKNYLDKLTKNTTIDELFGVEIAEDKKSIANKQQLTPLTKDPIRLEYFAEIDKELLENSSTIISKSNYDLASIPYGGVAVSYKNLNPVFKVSDNISLQIWFNIHNYLRDEVYNFLQFYDADKSIGWKSYLSNDKISVVLNDDTYTFDLLGYDQSGEPVALEEDVWHCYVLNINQRQRHIEQFIYKRDVDYEEDADKLGSTVLRKLYQEKIDMTPIEYRIQNLDINPVILASDMKITNIRLFSDVIPENVQNKILNQYIIGDDSKYLIFGDNATTRIYLSKFPLNYE